MLSTIYVLWLSQTYSLKDIDHSQDYEPTGRSLTALFNFSTLPTSTLTWIVTSHKPAPPGTSNRLARNIS